MASSEQVNRLYSIILSQQTKEFQFYLRSCIDKSKTRKIEGVTNPYSTGMAAECTKAQRGRVQHTSG